MATKSEANRFRRVVTGYAGTKSVIKSDELLDTYRFKATLGLEHTMVWAGSGIPQLNQEPKADYPLSIVPAPGATNIQFVTFPPESPERIASIDQEAAGQEYSARLPGLAETFQRDEPGMHVTPTLDYSVVFEGEIWLEVDDHQTVPLKRGDVVVQHGARHAWRNKGNASATMPFVMLTRFVRGTSWHDHRGLCFSKSALGLQTNARLRPVCIE
jgi:hypothetical protein